MRRRPRRRGVELVVGEDNRCARCAGDSREGGVVVAILTRGDGEDLDRSERVLEDDRLVDRCAVRGGLRSGEVSFSAICFNIAGRGPQSSLSTAVHAAFRVRAMQASDP